jgi:hypothetical protein
VDAPQDRHSSPRTADQIQVVTNFRGRDPRSDAELQAWAEAAARLNAGQVVAVASLAGVPASEIFKLVEVLLNYV